jgi:arylformamidase
VSALRDISVPLRPGTVVWEGDPEVRVERAMSIADGAIANVSHLTMSVHTGTHLDAPLHMIDGAPGMDAIDPARTVGPAWVADLTHLTAHVGPEDLEAAGIPAGTERLLLHTRNSDLWERDAFTPDFLGVTPDAAGWVVARGIGLLGVDYLSVAPSGDPLPTHVVLLEAGVVILEGADLRGVPAGLHELVCLPLRLDGCDGAPARAMLRERS